LMLGCAAPWATAAVVAAAAAPAEVAPMSPRLTEDARVPAVGAGMVSAAALVRGERAAAAGKIR